jgi:hypothetical protein
MWETLERARRRLLRDGPRSDAMAPGAATGSTAAVDAATDLSYSLSRFELERLIGNLTAGSGPDEGRPDTPARLEKALSGTIETVAGVGRPTVTRRPAGLYTPETWHIEVTGADDRTREALGQAIRGGGTL